MGSSSRGQGRHSLTKGKNKCGARPERRSLSAQSLPACWRVHSAGKYLLALRRINNLQVLSGQQAAEPKVGGDRVPTPRVRELRRSPTEAEKAAWRLLRDRRLGAKFRRQFRLENGVLDFYCFEHRLAIELDGGVHSQIDQMRRDAKKEDQLRTLGIRLLRIPNAMVLEHPDEFVRKVIDAMRTVRDNARK